MESRDLAEAVVPTFHSGVCSTMLSEAERVLCWRLAVLARAGYPELETVTLATCAEVDLHRAVELLENGCSVGSAVRILL